jgi:hypothetical protein
MIETESKDGTMPELTAEMIRAQLDLLIRDEVFRSSKRSVAFLKYVVEMTLNGSANQIKERTIGIEVFARDPSYDTNLDPIVRTAAGAHAAPQQKCEWKRGARRFQRTPQVHSRKHLTQQLHGRRFCSCKGLQVQ